MTLSKSKAYQRKDENLKHKYPFQQLISNDSFKIQCLNKFDQKQKEYNPELYLHTLSGLLKGTIPSQFSSPDSGSNKKQNHGFSKSNCKIRPKKKFNRRIAKIPTFDIQDLSNKLNEIEKHMDSVYGAFCNFEQQEYSLGSQGLSDINRQKSRQPFLKFEENAKNYNKISKSSKFIKSNETIIKNSGRCRFKSNPLFSHAKNDYNSEKLIAFDINLKIDEVACDSDDEYFNCEINSKLNYQKSKETQISRLPMQKLRK